MSFNFNTKAIGYSILAFIGLYIINLLISPLLMNVWFLKQLMGIAVLLVPGFLAGRIAAERGFTHGAITGVLGTVVSALAATLVALIRANAIPVSAIAFFFWMTTNALLCGFGGMVGQDPTWLKSK